MHISNNRSSHIIHNITMLYMWQPILRRIVTLKYTVYEHCIDDYMVIK